MVIRRKQARGRPPEDSSRDSPAPRRAKAVASANIAAQFMTDDRGPSPKVRKIEGDSEPRNGKIDSDLKMEDDSDPKSSTQNSDTCAICLGTRVDPTLLDNCVHSFCYSCTTQWFKYSEKCPLCMALTKTFWHGLSAANGREAVSVSELHTAAEAARLAERGQSQPPLDEQECIRLRIRRLQRRLSQLQTEMGKNTRDDRKLEFHAANSRLVSEISRLEMLRRDATTRVDLVSDVVFRSLIYKDNLEWSSIDRNANRVAFSPAVFKANVADSTNRLRAFLERELPIVWRNRRPKESRDQYYRHRDVVVSDIILWCSEYQINSPQFSRNLRTAGIYPSYLQRFQSELFEFASSMLTLRNFDSTSTYSSPEVRRMLERRNRRGENNEEVVTVSDSDDSDSAVIPLDDVRDRPGRHRNGRDDDIIVLSDDNLSDRDALLIRGESNYVRDEAASSNSETSNAGDFYTRPACRLPRTQFPPPPLRAIDAFGVLREIYAGFPESRFSNFHFGSLPNDFPFMFHRRENQDHEYSRRSRSRSPIRGVDNTIVLSSEDESSDTVRMDTRRRTRNRFNRSETSSSSQDTIAANGISWLNPANTERGPTSFGHLVENSAAVTAPSSRYRPNSPQWSPVLSHETSYSKPSAQPYTVYTPILPRPVLDSPSYQSVSHHYDRYPPVTPQSSPRTLEDLPSTSKAETTANSGNEIQSQNSEPSRKRPKSLFQPSPAKTFNANSEVEIRVLDENKLLAKLFHERQLRNRQGIGQDVQTTSADGVDTSNKDNIVAERSDENKLLAKLFHERQLRNRQGICQDVQTTSADGVDTSNKDNIVAERSGDSTTKEKEPCSANTSIESNVPANVSDSCGTVAEIPRSSGLADVPSSSLGFGDNVSANLKIRRGSGDSRSKRHRGLSWKFLFKKFRRKMKHEKSRRKRERLYEFIMDMKRELEKERSSRNYSENGEESYRRSSERRSYSSSSRRSSSKLRYRDDRDREYRRRRSSSDSEVSHSRDRDEHLDEEYDRRRSRSYSPSSASDRRHRNDYEYKSRQRSTSPSDRSSDWKEREEYRSGRSRSSSRNCSHSSSSRVPTSAHRYSRH
ncbi:zinc finger, C3HC4 type [Ancylostoma caninum]|uniref:RING-type E3 ubiquitin transferase n=1 Tax=Ancylostoma caninum TaxID=29170 RepID=A0A368H0U1_ANCCA|nr:zinc finger, C3HC4 type [Ancylostoma caninum]